MQQTSIQDLRSLRPFPLPTGTWSRLDLAWQRLRMEPAHAIALLLISLALQGWSAAACGTLNKGGCVFFLLYPLAAYYIGRLLLAVVDVEPLVKRSFAVLFLLGYLSLGLLQFATHSFLPGSLVWQFGAIFTSVVLSQLLLKAIPRKAASDAWTTVYLSGFCLLAATCWARGLLQPVDTDGADVIFRTWLDIFSHANLIARFTTAPGLWGMGNAEIVGLPAKFYHYAGYLGPATQSAFLGASGFDTARSCWVPMGTFLTGLAAYVLVLPWAGRAGGIVAAVALLTVPDPSFYWPRNGYLAYHWLQQIGGAGMYGTACGALSLALLLQWRRQQSRSALVLALALAAATVVYKAQIFFVLIPLVGACTCLYLPGASRRRRVALFLTWLGFCCLGALLLDLRHPEDPPFGLNPTYFQEYCRSLALDFPSGISRWLLESGFDGLGRSRYYAAGMGICAIATFGTWLVIGLLLLIVKGCRRRMSVTDAPPWLALGIFLTLMAGLKDFALVGHNRYEITHRPLVWVYFLLCTWCASWIGRFCTETLANVKVGASQRTVVAMLLSIPLLLLPMRMGRCVQEGKSIWRVSCANLRVPNGFVSCAHFLAQSGKPTDVIQDSHCDDKLILGGLAEKRSYLARPDDWQRDKSPEVRQEVNIRRANVRDSLGITHVAKLRQATERMGIRWFLLHPDDNISWPSSVLQSPAFESDGYRVFDLTTLPSALSSSVDRIAESREPQGGDEP